MIQHREKLQPPMKPVAPSRPRLSHVEAHRIFESIDRSDVSGLRDRALISLMFHNHLRPADALGMRRGDLLRNGGRRYLRIFYSKRVTKRRNRVDEIILPLFPEAEKAVTAYLAMLGVASDLESPLLCTVDPKDGSVTTKPLSAKAAHVSINRRAGGTGLKREISLYEFRTAGAHLLGEQSKIYAF